jgi:hypothetical protein
MLRRSGTRALAALAVAAVLGCDRPTSPSADLALARQRWAERAPQAYSFVLVIVCGECPSYGGRAVRVTVQGKTVTSRVYVATGEAVEPSAADAFPAVEGLFARIEQGIRERYARVTVQYDPFLGYPVDIFFDHNAAAVDDEGGYAVSSFEATGATS